MDHNLESKIKNISNKSILWYQPCVLKLIDNIIIITLKNTKIWLYIFISIYRIILYIFNIGNNKIIYDMVTNILFFIWKIYYHMIECWIYMMECWIYMMEVIYNSNN
jgi:hypothetical protein